MKFNLLVLALLGQTDAASLHAKIAPNASKNATVLAALGANATSGATAGGKDGESSSSSSTTTTTTTTYTTTTYYTYSWSSSSSSSSSWTESESESSSYSSNSEWQFSLASPMVETETVTETESADLGDAWKYAQIKLVGNNDGRTAFIPTTAEPYIKASISTHRDINNLNAYKRPKGNKRYKKQKFAFVQDNDWIGYEQKWMLERHPKQDKKIWKLVDTTGHCLTANNPQDFKRNKISSYVTSVVDNKKMCTFWKKQASGDGWNIVMARPGMGAKNKKYAFQNGWGLSILNNKKTDTELGPGTSYLVLHQNQNKFSIWSSKILGAPPQVVNNITVTLNYLNQPVEMNDTNATNSTNDTAPAAPAPTTAAPAAAPAPAATPAPANNTNKSNGTNKTKKPRKMKKRKLPEPFKGRESDEEDDHPMNQDRTIDLDDDDDCDDPDESLRDKIVKSLMMY